MRQFRIFFLVSSDILILYATLALTLVIRYLIIVQNFQTLISSAPLHFIPFTIIFIFWLIIFWAAGLYDLARLRNGDKFYKTLTIAFGINAAIAIAFFYFIPYFIITPKINLFIDLALTFVLIGWWRMSYNNWLQKSFRVNLAFLGAAPETLELKEYLSSHPQLGYRVIDVVAPDNLSELENILRTNHISLIVSALKLDHSARLTKALVGFLKKGIAITDLSKFYENVTGRVPISIIQEVWFLENIGEVQKALYDTIKRAADIIGAVVLGIITIALMPFVALAILISYPGPVFYRQIRIGQSGKFFTLLKFRSLADGLRQSDEMRKPYKEEITTVGKFLRKTHIDELPQVWNILRGHMSFIGPRPEKPEFVQKFSSEIPFYEMRHLVKPGTAGWAQLNNPYAGPTMKETLEKLQYDLYYIKNRSLLLDLKILLKTIRILVSGAGR